MIRKWEYTDNKKVEEIEKNSFSDPWSLSMILDTFIREDFIGFVYEEKGEVIGYVGGNVVFEDGEIFLIAVDEKYRRKGVATSLIKTFCEKISSLGAKKVFLEVRRDNEEAQSVYESIGFTYMGVRKNYYQGNEDALIMSMIL